MAVGNTTRSPITNMRDSFQLQAKIQEAKVLGPAGAKTDMIQKLALTAQPSWQSTGAKKLSQGITERATAPKEKPETKTGGLGTAAKTGAPGATTKASALGAAAKTGAMGTSSKTGGIGAEAKTGGMGTSAGTTAAKISTVYNGSDGFTTEA